MSSFLPRASFLIPFLAAFAVTGSACGGRFAGEPGPGGDDGGSSSGSSSGGSGSSSGVSSSSSSGGGSGSSSGISSSSSSGGGSGSSGGGSSSSSGGGVCPPAPGEGSCSSGEQCNYGSGCSAEYCSCDSAGTWQCISPECPPPECPPGAPYDGTSCNYEGQTCDYGSNGGTCGETCSCTYFGGPDGGSLAWQCYADPCPPPVCPSYAPQAGTACAGIGTYCYYPDDAGSCSGETCECDPSGIWSCTYGGFCDAGAPPPDAGWAE